MKRKPHLQTLESLKARCEEIGNCWIWTGATDGKGRPVVVHAGKRISPRRLARQLTDGREIYKSRQVTCTCGDIACISPACSLVTVPKTTHKMAVERGSYTNAARDRKMTMTKRARSEYKEEAILRIRAAETAKQAAEETGVSLAHAKAIRAGTSRRDYSNPFAGLGA